MKVPRADVKLRQAADMLAEVISSAGHEPFLATDEIAGRGLTNPQDFMPFVREHIQTADLVILLHHPELRGGLIEAGIAYAQTIPIWLCHRPGEHVSSSMRGCADETFEYKRLDDLQKKLSSRLNDGF